MSSYLLVTLHDVPAGELRRDQGSMQFRYLDEYVAGDHPPISQSLPVRSEPYGHRLCAAVFGGVLPEQDVRDAAAAMLGVSSTNDYKLLEELGGDCAGALEFLVDGSVPNHCVMSRTLDFGDLDQILRELPDRPLPHLAGDDGHVRMSLAGAQSKLPVIVTDTSMSLPGSHGQPSTHIIKPEPVRYPGLVANEALCMTLARVIEFDVAEVMPAVTTGRIPYLLIARYDRDALQAPVRRLHQEDICQALGLQPDQKYQKEGGPSVRDVVSLLRRISPVPTRDIRRFWDTLVFNVLVGNCDAHGKNYSLLYDGGQPVLAPLYDLVSTAVYPGLSRQLAMSIGAARVVDDVTLDSWSTCAEDCGLSARQAVQRVRSTAAMVQSIAATVAKRFEDAGPEAGATLAAILDGIDERARRWGVTAVDAPAS